MKILFIPRIQPKCKDKDIRLYKTLLTGFKKHGDELIYSWSLIAGEDLDWSYGDLNQDNTINIQDVIILVQIILNEN